MQAISMLHRYDALTAQIQTMLDAAHERERVNLNTIRELTLALRVSEIDNRELRARCRAYDKERANGAV